MKPVFKSENRRGDVFTHVLERKERFLLSLARQDKQITALGAVELIQRARASRENSTALICVCVGIVKASATPATVACTPDSCTKYHRTFARFASSLAPRNYYSCSFRRGMKSELALQFLPQPIDETILLDRSSICSCERFCFVHVAIQSVEISKQKCVAGIKRATIFLVLQETNCPVDISLRKCSRNQVWHGFQRRRSRFFRHTLRN